MKKSILILAMGLSLCANAQLTVVENGQVQIGDVPSNLISSTADFTICKYPVSSNNTTMNPSLKAKQSTGSIAFGAAECASISGGGPYGLLSLTSTNLIEFNVGNTKSAICLKSLDNSFTSKFNIKSPSFLTTSDARLKKNVTSISDCLDKLLDVNAVSYNLMTSSNASLSEKATKETSTVSSVEDERIHFGFIAQEIQELYPNLVVEDEDGLLSIDYTGFIPLLVEAYKDLSKQVKAQEELIIELTNQSGPRFMPAAVNGVETQMAALKQNRPNPFNASSSIECTVPQNVTSAFLCVYDLQGKQVRRIDIRERGNVVSIIDASSLAPGMYIYSLIADGVEIDSKRMIITD